MKALVLGDTTPLAKTLIAALIAADEVCFVLFFFFFSRWRVGQRDTPDQVGTVTLLNKERNRMWAELAGASEKLTMRVVEFDALAVQASAFGDADVVFACLDSASEGGDTPLLLAAQLCRSGGVEHFCAIVGSATSDRELGSKALEALHQRLLHVLVPHVSLWHVAQKKKPLILSPRRSSDLVIEPRVLALALLECALAYRDRVTVESAPSAIYDASCALAFSKLFEERQLRIKDPSLVSPRGPASAASLSPRSPRSPRPAAAPAPSSAAAAAATADTAAAAAPAASNGAVAAAAATEAVSPRSGRRRHHRGASRR